MLKKNNLVNFKKHLKFGASKKTFQNLYKKFGFNFKLHFFYLKKTQITRLINFLDSKLLGKNLKKKLYQFKVFSLQLKNSNKFKNEKNY